VELTKNGKTLVVMLLFRLLFGGYIVGMDQYNFNDTESAVTVLLIYILISIFTALFLLNRRYGLIGLIGLESIFIILNSAFFILTLTQIADVSMHDPLTNWAATLLRYMFSLLTLTFSIRAYRET
jgi:hypothetical protein